MDSPSRSNVHVPVLPKRREARLPATLSVRVLGIDAQGKAFHQAAVTQDISTSGVRLTGLAAKLNPGDIVGLQSSGEKCRFKVSWVEKNADDTFALGLQCVEKGKSLWREKLQQIAPGDRRNAERYPCNGSVSLRSSSFATPIWGTLRDIGEGGCYVQCVNVAPAGEIVSGQFILNGVQINGVAEVRTSRATVGMGLMWCDLGWDGQEKLANILKALSVNYGETNSTKVRALAQLDKLHQLVAALRERMESNHTLVDVQMIGRLTDAEEKLSTALKSLQS
ncbi:MAG: PilZ domain-containing protein [Acidobacteriota bacterium]|nr:PilZ domain-containing protein [Acidobacteriota bacterium]